MSDDDRQMYRCPDCGAWRLPEALMRVHHDCRRCPSVAMGGRRCELGRDHVGLHRGEGCAWPT